MSARWQSIPNVKTNGCSIHSGGSGQQFRTRTGLGAPERSTVQVLAALHRYRSAAASGTLPGWYTAAVLAELEAELEARGVAA